MYIIKDIWVQIKEYLFHDIKKHGKHLKDDKYIKCYNNVVNKLPRYIPWNQGYGPFIVYQSATRKRDRCVKFMYKMVYKNMNYNIVTYMLHPTDYVSSQFHYVGALSHELIENEYYNIFQN